MENKITIEGIVKWPPSIFEAQTAEQSDIGSIAIEHAHQKSEKKSVFGVKQFDNGEGSLPRMISGGEIAEGTHVKVTGFLRENNWKDKKTDEWKSRVEISAFEITVEGAAEAPVSVPSEPIAAAVAEDDDIPF